MSNTILSGLSVAALVGGSLLAFPSNPASAFTLFGPSAQPTSSGQLEEVYYRAGGYHGGYHAGYHGGYHRGYHGGYAYHGGAYRGGYYHGGYGYHPYGYGYGGAAAVGAAAIGAAAVGAAVAPRCWINNYGVQVCN